MGAFGWRRPLKAGSTVRTSGSVKYVVGAPPGPKSRGGDVTVLGGATGPLAGAWAAPVRGAITAAPAATPSVLMRVRLDTRWSASTSPRSCGMVVPPRRWGFASVGRVRLARPVRLPKRHASRRSARPSTPGAQPLEVHPAISRAPASAGREGGQLRDVVEIADMPQGRDQPGDPVRGQHHLGEPAELRFELLAGQRVLGGAARGGHVLLDHAAAG